MNKWLLYPIFFLIAVILIDEFLYKSVRMGFRGEHYSHLWYQPPSPLQ